MSTINPKNIVEGCRFSGCDSHSVSLSAAHRTVVRGNIMLDSGLAGVNLEFGQMQATVEQLAAAIAQINVLRRERDELKQQVQQKEQQ